MKPISTVVISSEEERWECLKWLDHTLHNVTTSNHCQVHNYYLCPFFLNLYIAVFCAEVSFPMFNLSAKP